MRVDKGGLDDAVVEDGEAAVILTSDSLSVAMKSKAASGKTPNGVHLPQSCERAGTAVSGTVVSTEAKCRIPVEDCEDVDSGREASGGEDVECLTNTLRGCSIQETAGLEIEEKLAELSVKEEEDDESQRTSLQSQSSIIMVDPPSLPHEEEEEKSDTAEDLAPRGPTAGKPANYRPENDTFNNISNKSYSSHNLDRFQQHAIPFPTRIPQHLQHVQAVNGYAHNGYAHNGFAQNGYSPSGYYGMVPQNGGLSSGYGMGSGGVAASGGKRGMEDDEDNPFKYTRPVEEVAYGAPPADLNDLSAGMKKPAAFAQISQKLGCGGQVMDNSPDILSPSSELGNAPFKFQSQFSVTDLDRMLELLGDGEQGQLPTQQLQQYTAAPPMQQQIKQQTLAQTAPLPTTCPAEIDFGQGAQVDKLAGRRIQDYDPGYSSENSPHSENMGSPGSSPKSTFSPMRPPSNMSQDSGIASPFAEDYATVVPSPPDIPQQKWVPGVDDYCSQNYGVTDTTQSSVFMSPHSMVNTMSPESVVSSDDLSMASAPSPTSAVMDNSTDQFFENHKDDLKDALEVVADDIKSIYKMKSAQKVSNAPPAANIPFSVTASAPNIPTPVAAQRNVRPEKLPIAPLPKTGNQLQQSHGQTAMVQGRVPVVVMPNTLGGQPVSTAAPVTSSQPVILMPQGQTPPVIVVVNNPRPQAPQQAKKKGPVPIRPRPGPPMPISASTPTPINSLPTSKTDSLPKLEPNVPPSLPLTIGTSVTAGLSGVQASPCTQPSPPPSTPGRKNVQNRNPQQSRMLNIARRLVASMTTKDLQFQDLEGDTYLHVSVCKADRNMVQALLERLTREQLQTMINTTNCMRQTPLYLAVSSNTPEMVELLIQFGADVNVFAEHTMADGRTKEVKAALHCAASNGEQYLQTLQALLAAKELNIDLVNSDGHTALHCAILEHGKPNSEGGKINNLPIIQALIKHGADPNAQGRKSGKTALMYALESRDITLIETIVALIDPARLRTYLKTQAFDSSTCLRIIENLQRTLDETSRHRLQACLKINSRRDNCAS